MGLYRRRQTKHLGSQTAEADRAQGLSLQRGNPLSSQYVCPCQSDSPERVVTFLLALQMERYGETIEDRVPPRALIRNVKKLAEEYGMEAVKRAIHAAVWKSAYPFATGFIRKVLGELGYESRHARSGSDQAGGSCTFSADTLWDKPAR